MILGILVMITALSISAVAIYYSVSGLVAIFAAAAIPIIIMGGALEIGKLVTAVWLHWYWHKAKWWLKTYLSISVLVLMFITSMGIFGFLSKAHIEQTAAAEEGIAQIERIDDELLRQEQLITRAEERIEEAEASVGEGNAEIQAQIDKEQERIDTAYTRIEPAIEEQNSIIQTQLGSLEDRVAVYEEEIKSLDAELTRLNALVEQYRSEFANTTVASIEQQVQPYNEQIAKLDEDLDRINTQANEYEARISELQIDTTAIEALKTRIAAIEESIVVTTNKLQSTERDKIREGQATIGVTSDGLFGSNTRRALQTWVEAQQERIAQLQAQETQLRTQAQNTLDAERQRLTDQVKDLRGTQTDNILQRKQGLLDAIDTIRSNSIEEAKVAKADIQSKIDTVLNTDIPANRSARQTAQEQITVLRQADDVRINAARQSIKDLRAGAEAQIAASNNLIQRLRDSLTVGKDPAIEAVIKEQQEKIIIANNSIDNLTEKKYSLQAEYRKLEAEVGPIKYLAEFIYGETDKDILEEAVRWVIIVIIFVFDPLAVLLLIASQATFELRRAEGKTNDNESNDYKHDEYAQSGSKATGSNENRDTGTREDKSFDYDTYAAMYEDTGAADSRGSNTTGVSKSDAKEIRPNLEDSKKKIVTDSSEELRQAERNALYMLKEKDETFRNSKNKWKKENPKETIKFYKTLYIQGKIEKFPWEESYQQNEEQNDKSIFRKIQQNRNDE